MLAAPAVLFLTAKADADGLLRSSPGHVGQPTTVARPEGAARRHLVDPRLEEHPLWRYMPASHQRALRELQRRLRW